MAASGVQFPKAVLAAGAAPMMLKSQLYTIVADRTSVDRDLEALRHAICYTITPALTFRPRLQLQSI